LIEASFTINPIDLRLAAGSVPYVDSMENPEPVISRCSIRTMTDHP